MEPSSPKRVLYFDVLNIAACFGVVLLHCTGRVFQFSVSGGWFLSMFLQTAAHWVVPVFFMLSGATLLDYRSRYSTSVFFKKRFSRIFVPFLIWSCIYLVWNCRSGLVFHSFTELVNLFLNNGIIYIFWFFYSLLALYFCTPVLSLLTKEENTRVVWYFFGLCTLNSTVFPLLAKAFSIKFFAYFPMGSGYVNYFLLGWLLKNEKFGKRTRIGIYIAGILGFIGMFFGTYWISARSGETNALFMDYSSIFCLPLSAAVFLFFKHVDWGKFIKGRAVKTLSTLSSASLGIYLIQILALTYFPKLFHLQTGSPVYMVFAPFAIYAACFCCVYIVKKIPILRKIFP